MIKVLILRKTWVEWITHIAASQGNESTSWDIGNESQWKANDSNKERGKKKSLMNLDNSFEHSVSFNWYQCLSVLVATFSMKGWVVPWTILHWVELASSRQQRRCHSQPEEAKWSTWGYRELAGGSQWGKEHPHRHLLKGWTFPEREEDWHQVLSCVVVEPELHCLRDQLRTWQRDRR